MIIKPKFGVRVKLCYTEDFFEDIANDVERWFDTSNHDENDREEQKNTRPF